MHLNNIHRLVITLAFPFAVMLSCVPFLHLSFITFCALSCVHLSISDVLSRSHDCRIGQADIWIFRQEETAIQYDRWVSMVPMDSHRLTGDSPVENAKCRKCAPTQIKYRWMVRISKVSVETLQPPIRPL